MYLRSCSHMFCLLIPLCLLAGSSTGCSSCGDATAVDTDGDGVPDDEDAFPDDPSEWMDTDGDGVGDNADAFPEDPTETVDTDGDGVGDNADAFPEDPTETEDTDGDGVGDNADAFPEDPTETVDTDGDGVGDNADAFPDDPTETADTDTDGVGDNADCDPADPNNWISCGSCADGDGDGHFVDCDAYDTIEGPDCDDQDENNWQSCASCVDQDADEVFVGCDAYQTILGPDCNDLDPLIHAYAADLPDNLEDENCDGTVLTGADGPGLYVDGVNACPGAGNRNHPYCDLQTAVDNAEPGSNIFVAGGAGLAYAEITISQPVHLFGGYEGGHLDCTPTCVYVPGPWTRDLENLPAEIVPVAGQAAAVVLSDRVSPVTMEGFIIHGGSGVSENTYGVTTGDISNSADVVLVRNTIDGGAPSYGFGFGVYLRGNAVLVENTIHGGNASRGTTGVHLGCRQALVLRNTIDGGDATATGATTRTTGVQNTGFALLDSNIIFGGQGGHESAAFTDTARSTAIHNVLIGGQPTETSAAFRHWAGSRCVLVNNTLYAGDGPLLTYGIDSMNTYRLVAVNNIVLGGGGSGENFIVHLNNNQAPTLVHNDLWGTNADAVLRYHDGSGYQQTSDLDTVNQCQWTNCQMSTGNVAVFPSFADFAYHLGVASPCIDAGTDPAPYLTELLDDRFVWYLPHDYDGDARPLDGDGSGTSEWDIGVDELAP